MPGLGSQPDPAAVNVPALASWILPLDAFATGPGEHHIVTTLCPGGKERMGD